MKALTIRNIDDEVFENFARRAKENERNPEAHARFLIMEESKGEKLDAAGALLSDIWTRPAPGVDPAAVEKFLAGRGKRSHRPA